jgi:hypothetical protein
MADAAAAAVAAAAAAAAVPSTRYERTLRNCGVEMATGAASDETRFREWARQHQAEATKQAGRFVARLLPSHDKAANPSSGSTARLHVTACKSYGISVVIHA